MYKYLGLNIHYIYNYITGNFLHHHNNYFNINMQYNLIYYLQICKFHTNFNLNIFHMDISIFSIHFIHLHNMYLYNYSQEGYFYIHLSKLSNYQNYYHKYYIYNYISHIFLHHHNNYHYIYIEELINFYYLNSCKSYIQNFLHKFRNNTDTDSINLHYYKIHFYNCNQEDHFYQYYHNKFHMQQHQNI